MGNQFYVDSFQRNPSLVDDAIKLKHLGIQQDALGQRRAAAQRKMLGKTPELGRAWDAHAIATEQAYMNKLSKKIQADGVGDVESSRNLERELKGLKHFLQADAAYGTKVDAMLTEANKNGHLYTTESLDEVNNFYELQRQALTSDENGNLLFNGKPISSTNSPFTKTPSLVRRDDNVYDLMSQRFKKADYLEKSVEEVVEGSGDYYDTQYTDVNKAKNEMTEWISHYVDEGVLSPQQAEQMVNRRVESITTNPVKTPHIRKEGGGFQFNIGDGNVDTGKYKISVSETNYPTGKSEKGKGVEGTKTSQISISHPSGTQPYVPMKFTDISTGTAQDNEVKLNTITKDPNGDGYIVEGDGYELAKLVENGDVVGEKVVNRRNIKFKVDDTNRDIIQDTYLGGQTIESFMGEEISENNQSKPQTSSYTKEQEAAIKANMDANPDYSREEIIEALGY